MIAMEARLYGILDMAYVSRANLSKVANEMLRGGVDVVQLRAKNLEPIEIEDIGHVLRGITRECGAPLIINDHPEIAAAVGADGVHVGQDDLSVSEARERAGNIPIVGKSTHSLEQAVAGQEEGANYIGFGPIFPTQTKPDYTPIGTEDIAEVHQRVNIPIFGIGGITLENLPGLLEAGLRRVVIVSAILLAEDISAYVRAVKHQLIVAHEG